MDLAGLVPQHLPALADPAVVPATVSPVLIRCPISALLMPVCALLMPLLSKLLWPMMLVCNPWSSWSWRFWRKPGGAETLQGSTFQNGPLHRFCMEASCGPEAFDHRLALR